MIILLSEGMSSSTASSCAAGLDNQTFCLCYQSDNSTVAELTSTANIPSTDVLNRNTYLQPEDSLDGYSLRFSVTKSAISEFSSTFPNYSFGEKERPVALVAYSLETIGKPFVVALCNLQFNLSSFCRERNWKGFFLPPS